MEVCHQSVDECVRVSFSNTMNLTWKYKAHQPESLHTTSISSFNIITVITVNLFISTGLQVSLTHCIVTHCCDSLVPFLKKEKITNDAGSIFFHLCVLLWCVGFFIVYLKKKRFNDFFSALYSVILTSFMWRDCENIFSLSTLCTSPCTFVFTALTADRLVGIVSERMKGLLCTFCVCSQPALNS